MDKKVGFHPGEVWLGALRNFEEELHEELEIPGSDRLRFQNGRMYGALVRGIQAVASGKWELGVMFDCYEYMAVRLLHSGYGEVRRLHGEEMKWRGMASAREFCRWMPGRMAEKPEEIFLEELRSRVRSLCSWVECQTGFTWWLVFRDFRRGWRGTGEDRARAVAALYLSRRSFGARVIQGYGGKPWTERQWCNILEQAVKLVGKKYECKELEKWVWWCYPVFRRYRWNVREVLESASRRGIDFGETRLAELEKFQKYWIRVGLRFMGGRHPKNRTPPLRDFVEGMVLPDPVTMWGEAGGLLFLPKKR
jgi:hypothetical protein